MLPDHLTVKVIGKKILLVHGSPEAIDDPLRIDTPQRRFLELAKTVKEDIVLCGHTHEYFDKKAGNVRFINPGSIGRPFDGDPRASYAIMEFKDGDVIAKNYRIAYDIKKNLNKMKKEGFPKSIVDSIRLGKSLDEL